MKRIVFTIVVATTTAVIGCGTILPRIDRFINPPAVPAAPLRQPRVVLAKLTAYDAGCRICTGKWWKQDKTASGTNARTTRGLAADICAFPFRTKVHIPGMGIMTVDDTGGAMRQDWRKRGVVHFDVRLSTHKQARKFGVRWARVTILPQP